MKDMHCHLLYGIDDGCKTIEESIVLLKKMKDAGINEVVLTPHYVGNYDCNNRNKKKLLTEFKKRIKKENIDVSLYLGNEVFITDNLLELLDKGEISTINNSKYILIELPLRDKFNGTKEVFMELVSHGYVPILAHPERYRIFLEKPDLALEYLKMGVLFQGNFTSLFGRYGKDRMKLLKYYIKKGYISFLGSDTHHDFNYNLTKLEKKLHRINKDNDYINGILYSNFDKVINNQDIPMVK